MAIKNVQMVRHTTTLLGAFIGKLGQLTVDTDKSVVVVHDGALLGGNAMAREDMSNVADATTSIPGRMSIAQVAALATAQADIIVNANDIALNVADIAVVIADIATNVADIATINATLGTYGTVVTRNTGVASGNVPLVGTASATELLAGLAEIATNTEAAQPANDTHMMTPNKIQYNPHACKAWARVTAGVGPTFDAQRKFATVVRSSAGVYVFTYSDTFDAVGTVVIANAQESLTTRQVVVKSASGTGCTLNVFSSGVLTDPTVLHVVVFGFFP